jgi:hypothetical protein
MEDLLKLKPKDPIQFIIDYIDLGPTCATQVGIWGVEGPGESRAGRS